MNNSHNWLLVPATFLVAFVLTILPMPSWTVWFRPAWIAMVLIYWVMETPHHVSVGTAWVVGMLLDALNGSLLGEHALALTIIALVVDRIYSQLRMFPLAQQGLSVCLLVLLYQFILYCVQGFIGQLPRGGLLYWSASLTSMLLWPWVFTIIRDFRRRSRAV